MEEFELGEEVAAGASCKVLRGSINQDGETIMLAIKDFIWEGEAAELLDDAGDVGDGRVGRGVAGMVDLRATSVDAAATAAAASLQAQAVQARANPVWLPDREHTSCMLGSKCAHIRFSYLVKPHHCRYCGWIVCGDCRKKELAVDRWVSSDTYEIKALVPPATKVKAVCDSCFAHAPGEVRRRAQRSQRTDDYATVRQKMRAEAEILHRCSHRNVVRVVGVCDNHPSLCLLLEWCSRGSLWDVLLKEREAHASRGAAAAGGGGGAEGAGGAAGSSSPGGCIRLDATRLGYAMDVVSALAHLHGPGGGSSGQRGWVVAHRDVKSHNFLVAEDGTVKLADLGDAQLESNSTSGAGRLSAIDLSGGGGGGGGGGGDSAISPIHVMAAGKHTA